MHCSGLKVSCRIGTDRSRHVSCVSRTRDSTRRAPCSKGQAQGNIESFGTVQLATWRVAQARLRAPRRCDDAVAGAAAMHDHEQRMISALAH
jgi:hypothetical protein